MEATLNPTLPQPNRQLLGISEVLGRLSISKSVLYVLRRKGEFPNPVQLSPGRVAWREKDINDWIDSRPLAA